MSSKGHTVQFRDMHESGLWGPLPYVHRRCLPGSISMLKQHLAELHSLLFQPLRMKSTYTDQKRLLCELEARINTSRLILT